MSQDPQIDELPPLPEALSEDSLPPLPANIEQTPEAAPLPQAAAPAAKPGRKPLLWALLLGALAIYGALDAWQAKQAEELAVIAAKNNTEAALQAEQNAQRMRQRREQILNFASTLHGRQIALQQLDSMIQPLKSRTEACMREIDTLKETQKSLREKKEDLENNQ